MSDLIVSSSMMPLPVREDVSIRPATMADLAFIDSLQKQHTQMVGWMPTKTLEGKISAGHVLVAVDSRQLIVDRKIASGESSLPTTNYPLSTPIGYCIGNDQYFKRDDVGVIYQMNVAPGRQRGLVGARLLKAMFERAAYGCRLFCCWCAQDIEANRFWEAMGFVPLAFRAGSESKARVHIFWQKRIRAGDVTTPYWFPAQTTGGSIREDRLVLPIPPGRGQRSEKKDTGETPVPQNASIAAGGLRFATASRPVAEKPRQPKQPRPKRKNDPKLVTAARELRDRWLEQVNSDPGLLLARGKYDVARELPAAHGGSIAAAPLLLKAA